MNISIGDTLTYVVMRRHGSGKVIGMELTEQPQEAYGKPVPTVGIESVRANKVMFDIDNGKFVYSYQVQTVNGIPL
jgi:hypothetical protein